MCADGAGDGPLKLTYRQLDLAGGRGIDSHGRPSEGRHFRPITEGLDLDRSVRNDAGAGAGGKRAGGRGDVRALDEVGIQLDADPACEIGTASCRERVCQYGYVSVVA